MPNLRFRRAPNHGIRCILLVLIALCLIVLDRQPSHVSSIRWYLSAIVAPIQYAVDWPLEMIDHLRASVATQRALLQENAHLRAKQSLLKAQVQKFIALEKENQQLRALLQSLPRNQEHISLAQILAVVSDPYQREFVLSKGAHDGVYRGQAVLDANGVLGQIIFVGPLTSRVLLLTDNRSAIPVQDQRNGIRTIAVGTNADETLLLKHVPKTTSIKKGDMLLTSGLGKRFPQGYPLGEVVKVANRPGEQFAHIEIKASAQINRSQIVLLVWQQRRGEHDKS